MQVSAKDSSSEAAGQPMITERYPEQSVAMAMLKSVA
jgi:hypothetical protein